MVKHQAEDHRTPLYHDHSLHGHRHHPRHLTPRTRGGPIDAVRHTRSQNTGQGLDVSCTHL